MEPVGVWASANPVCFTVLALPVALGLVYTNYKVIKAILTNTW